MAEQTFSKDSTSALEVISRLLFLSEPGSGCVFGLLSRDLPTRKPFELFEYPLPGCLEMGKGDKHFKPVMLWVGGTGRHGVVRKQEIVAALGRSRCLCVFLGHSSLSTPSTHALCSSSSMVPSSWVVASVCKIKN